MSHLFLALVSADPDTSLALAKSCSPRVARYGTVVLADVSGSARTIGSPATMAREVLALASAHDLRVRVGVAPTMVSAWLVAHAQAGATVVDAGAVAQTLADLPLRWLETTVELDPEIGRVPDLRTSYAERLTVFAQWGIATIGGVARLPRRDVHARMGAIGVRLHQAASGEDAHRFVPLEEVAPFVARMALEWPIDGLEPLAFVVSRLAEQLSARLVGADRGAIVLRTRLRLVTRETHERVLCLPAPIADPRVLRTLVLLDLESHPPSAGVDAVELHLEVMPGRIVQGSLLAPSVPTPEDLATLTARLIALVGESRVGAPCLVDSFNERRIGMQNFTVRTSGATETSDAAGSRTGPTPLLRRFRMPLVATVIDVRGVPVRVRTHVRALPGGDVLRRAGPWRTSGEWWTENGGWDRDEWDLALTDGAIYRVVRDRRSGQWAIEGVLD